MSDDGFSLSRAEGVSYEQQMDLLAAIVRPITMFDLDPLLSTVARADSVGFLTDPTAYRDAQLGNRLEHQRRFLTKLKELQRVVAEINEDVLARGTQRAAYAPAPGTSVRFVWNGLARVGTVTGAHPTQPMVAVRFWDGYDQVDVQVSTHAITSLEG